jgi:hypothetical protein
MYVARTTSDTHINLMCLQAMLAIYMAFLVVALLLLGELFSFHLVLISRQMSTYDFIVAQREQQQKGGPAVSTASSLADLLKKAITCQVRATW